MIYRSITFGIIFLFTSILSAQVNDKSKTSLPQVEIAGSQLIHFTSSIVDQEYNLYINLPRNYSDASRTFPVLFLLDAQWDFPLANAIYGEQYYDGFLPDLVIVGITWGGENPNHDLLRRRDFTPSNVAQSQPSGGAPKFIEFIKKELIPFLEENYRVSKDRALMGSSLGGLLTLCAMFTETDLFSKYILTSPALQWDNGILYQIEKSYSEKTSKLPARLYMAIGGYEYVPMLQQFYALLKKRNYEQLEIGYNVIDGIGHSGSKADGYTRGMQFAYARPALILDNSVLEQYAGVYEIFPGYNVKVEVEKNQLVAFTPENYKIIMYAETEKDFYAKGQYVYAHFKKDESGKVTGFQFEDYNGGRFVTKK